MIVASRLRKLHKTTTSLISSHCITQVASPALDRVSQVTDMTKLDVSVRFQYIAAGMPGLSLARWKLKSRSSTVGTRGHLAGRGALGAPGSVFRPNMGSSGMSSSDYQ